MAMTIHVDIVSAEAKIFSGTAEMLVATSVGGEVGIVARHAQMLTRLKPGQVRLINANQEDEVFYIKGGFLEVQPHAVTVLADSAMRATDLDEHAALAAKQRVEEAMAERKTDFDYSKARAELAEAIAQIQAISKLRKKFK